MFNIECSCVPTKINPDMVRGEIVTESYLSEININIKDIFLISEKAEKDLPKEWLKFAYEELLLKNNTADYRIGNYMEKLKNREISFTMLPDKVKQIVMLSGEYAVINPLNLFEYERNLNYLDLINILLSKEKLKVYGYSYKHLVDRFFIGQWAKGRLLYPLFLNKEKRFQRQFNYEMFLYKNNIPFIKSLFNYAKLYNKIPIFRNAFNIILATNWRFVSDVTNKGILKIKEIIEKSNLNSAQKKWYIRSLNFIVYALIQDGRTDLKTPYQYTKELFPRELKFFKKVDELVEKCPNYYPLKKEFIEYIKYLEVKEQLASSTINTVRSYLMTFIDYIIEKKCDCVLLQKTFDEMFNFMKDDNFVKYINETKGKKGTSIIRKIATFLGYAGYLSPYIKKMLPKEKSRIKETPRIPFKLEMIKDLVDILLNRPPYEPTKWSKEKADISWWPHEVYPVLPLMILLHLYIPVRGSQIRNLCRRKSFVLNEEGKIEKLVINTDKNRHRDYLQEIPFVFSRLEIFNDFLKWHKEYYPVLPLYEYDKNSPFDKIEPLFIQPLGLKPIDKRTHLIYLKRVFAQYRIELALKGKNNIHFVSLTEKGKQILGKEFFESVEELNEVTNEFIYKYVNTIYDIHTFRVTGVTRYLEAGLPFNVVMMLTGHTNPNIMLHVYNKLSFNEKKELLKSAEKSIMFDNPEKLKDAKEKLIQEEIFPYYDPEKPEKLKSILETNKLFTPRVKKGSNTTKIINAIDEVAKISPLNWIPIAGGICPSTTCPDGREKRCSLCPYFVTGIHFLDEIIFRVNKLILEFNRKVEEYKLSKENVKLEDLEILIEEIYGWLNIIEDIQNSLDNNEANNKLPAKLEKSKIVGQANIPDVLAYLENCYQAKVLGTAPDIYGIKVLTIKAIKLAMKKNNTDINEIISNESKAIDYIMSYYQKSKKSPEFLTSFLKDLGEDVKRINKLFEISYNYS